MKDKNLTFGIDVGSNSLGWAVLERTNVGGRIVAAGVRIFPEGVDRDQTGGEQSKNEARRKARGTRRQIARRARRKRRLREALVAANLLPDIAKEKSSDPRRVAWESDAYHKADPYMLRAKALNEKLTLHELGRVLLHLGQRRGFLSNRKQDGTRKERSELLDPLLESMSELAGKIGEKTLGQHLANLRSIDERLRVRKLHTRRDMYEKEFEAIWNKQREYYPDILTNGLLYGSAGKQRYPLEPKARGKQPLLDKFGLHGLLFFQRTMYWPKSAVGRCELEPKLPRCPKGDRAAQRFRLLQEVNNLRLLDSDTLQERNLTEQELQRLLAFLQQHKEIKFDEIPKKIGLLENVRFNLQRGGRKALDGMRTDCLLAGKKLFGKEWFDRGESEKNAIVRALLDESLDDAGFAELAQKEWGIPKELAAELIKVNFADGHARYSLVAIETLLPSLEKGLPLNSATGEPCALSEAGYKKPHELSVGKREHLPEPRKITNPLVRQALFEIRKVVNALLREYGKPDHIHIEMAREIKGNAEIRSRLSNEMRDREALRNQAGERIQEEGLKATESAKTRYLLWQQQHGICIYSGKPISVRQLLQGEVDEDHILPYSRSLDDSQMNRVICFRDENRDKGDRTPHEWLAAAHPEQYEQVLQRATKLPYPKAKRFRQPTVELTDFFARQFADTAYIATQLREYVECLGVKVVCTKGQHTAELRRRWGLNTVLRDDGLDLKNREDHRHHAVDAIVIALTDPKRLQELASLARTKYLGRDQEQFEEPWQGFRHETEKTINSINVSFRPMTHIHGGLHNDMFYGPTQKMEKPCKTNRPWAKKWIENENSFVRRKKVIELNNTDQISKVRDETVRNILWQYLIERGIDPGTKQKINPKVWNDGPKMLSGTPIKKVRLIEHGESYKRIHQNAFVELSSNHHYEIVDMLDENGHPLLDKKGQIKRNGHLVTMWEAAQRIQQAKNAYQKLVKDLEKKELSAEEFEVQANAIRSRLAKEFPVIKRDHGARNRFLMSLSINEMVEVPGKKPTLHRVQKMSEGIIILRPHYYAGKVKDTDKPPIILRTGPTTLKGRKVIVDILGRVYPTK